MGLADRFNLSEDQRKTLVDILNEPDLEDCDLLKISDHTQRIRALFDCDDETYSAVNMEELCKSERLELVLSN